MDTSFAPEHLSLPSRILWADIIPRRARSPERRALLQVALEAKDRADAARGVLEVEGMFCGNEGRMIHAHPAVAVERDARRHFLAAWKALGLTWDAGLDAIPWP